MAIINIASIFKYIDELDLLAVNETRPAFWRYYWLWSLSIVGNNIIWRDG
jgi:hypothetical protein